MTGIVLRSTVETIVAQRNHALDLYGVAHAALAAAREAQIAAGLAGQKASPGTNGYNFASEAVRKGFLPVLQVPEREEYLAAARRLTDIDVWSHLIAITDLESLMDKKAKDQFRVQLQDNPPEVTVENVVATLEQFALDAGSIFRRGIAECFSNLDRRFRSHDGWKIGSRVILTHCFNEFGSWNYYRNERDTIRDIERTFLVLDGKSPKAAYGGLVDAIESERRGGSGRRQSEVESDYFKVRSFKNGNAHIWFKRDDLLEQVNKLLGEYYAAPIPEERSPDADTGLNDPKTSLAKNYGFYPTPDAAADSLIEACPLHRERGAPSPRILEPSAGTGNLARRLVAKGAVVDCVEVQAQFAADLQRCGRYRRVVQGDFLAVRPDPSVPYDLVVMNPPFDRERDIDHVMHALKFVRPGGELVAVMSAGTEFRDARKSRAFRALMIEMGGHHSDLPPGSFASVGTYCNTIIVRVRLPDPMQQGRSPFYWGRPFEQPDQARAA